MTALLLPMKGRRAWQPLVVPVLLLALFAAWGTFFFLRSRDVLGSRLKSELQETAAVSALQLDPALLAQIRSADDVRTSAYRTVTTQLLAIKHTSPLLKSVYVMRRTENPLVLAFIADADAQESKDVIDENHDGVIEVNEAVPLPGDPYNIADAPALQTIAFSRPTTDAAFTTDQWGTVISGYAPILGTDGKAVAVLGIDMDARDYDALSQIIFSPVVYLLVLCAILSVGGSLIIWTWRRRVAVLTEMERERTALLDLLLHQLGTPFAAFNWWLDILKERMPTENQDVFERLGESVSRMSMIMKALYDAGNVGEHLASRAGAADVHATVHRVLGEVGKLLNAQKQVLRVDVSEDVGKVRLDPASLAGVLRELVENASGFSPHGSEIFLRAYRVRRAVHFEVQDQGCGIPATELARVGERFFRASNAYKVKPAGNGLGLSIARNIVRGMGGWFAVRSREGKGTIVSFRLRCVS